MPGDGKQDKNEQIPFAKEWPLELSDEVASPNPDRLPIVPDRTRLHFMRALVLRSAEEPAVLLARTPRHQGSGMLRSMVGINALLRVPPGPAALPAGATVFASLLQPV